jgi:hypothetical protein
VRPSDEHQHRSKRPNLFSTSRRSGGADDNILARLERKPAAAAAPAGRSRILMLGGAGVLIAALLGTLGMLVRDNAAVPRPMQVSAEPALAEAAPPRAAAPATIFDEPAAPVRADNEADTAPQPLQPVLDSPAPAIPAASPAKSTPTRIAATPRPQPATVKAAPVRPPRRGPVPTAEDPDVAILAAILSHAPRHQGQSAKTGDGGCGIAPAPPCPSGQF